MSPKSLDVKELKAIVDWVNVTEDIREFSLRFGDVELYVSRNHQAPNGARALPVPVLTAPPTPVQEAVSAAAAPQPAATAGEATVGVLEADEVVIKAPMVGTFYASPKPGQPPFVAVGDPVSADTVLCIVEVMKLMNNIEARVEGTVVRILVGNEQAVQYGQPLMVIKRS